MEYNEQIETRSKELNIDKAEIEKALGKFLMILTDEELVAFVEDMNKVGGCCSGSCSCSSCTCC